MEKLCVSSVGTPAGFCDLVYRVFGIPEDIMVFKDEAGFVVTPANIIAKALGLQAMSVDGSDRMFKVSIYSMETMNND